MIFRDCTLFLKQWLKHVFIKPQAISLSNLHDPKRYEHQIQKMMTLAKNKGLRNLLQQQYQGVPLLSFGIHQNKVARILAQTLREGTFLFGAARQRLIITGAKKGAPKQRIIYEFSLPDKIVSGVVAQLLTEMVEPLYSPHTYAFRRGVSTKHVITAFTNYLKKSYTHNPDCKGIYVIRADISNYSEQIYLGKNSLLWPELQKIFAALNTQPTAFQWNLIQNYIRPQTINLEHRLQSSIRGIPTGTAMNVFLCNFYTMMLDSKISALDGVFYARYCDDILLAHTDPHRLKQINILLSELLTGLGLDRKLDKDLFCYLSKAGNADTDQFWQGSNKLLHLGYRISGDGQFAISKLQQRSFLRDIQKRIDNCYRGVKKQSLADQGKIICAAINRAIEDRALAKSQTLNLLRDGADEGQLKHLDYAIALRIAEILSQQKGPRAFRSIPYKTIRKEWGLLSLLQLKLKKFKYETV